MVGGQWTEVGVTIGFRKQETGIKIRLIEKENREQRTEKREKVVGGQWTEVGVFIGFRKQETPFEEVKGTPHPAPCDTTDYKLTTTD